MDDVQTDDLIVFPMYVGVILNGVGPDGEILRIPHVCGGDPSQNRFPGYSRMVFPMYVGVILPPTLNRR